MTWVGIYTFLTKHIYMKVITDKQVRINYCFIPEKLRKFTTEKHWQWEQTTCLLAFIICLKSEVYISFLDFIQSPVNSGKSISYNLWHSITSKENESTSCIQVPQFEIHAEFVFCFFFNFKVLNHGSLSWNTNYLPRNLNWLFNSNFVSLHCGKI
jgi:hypothetical protein